MNNRMHQLDSIRGLASFSVMLHHISLAAVIPIITLLTTNYSPFKFFTNGHGAVILFFILSGFVLFLPFMRGKHTPYVQYITKRFFRIYIPYIVAIIFSFSLSFIIEHEHIKAMTSWFHYTWRDPVNEDMLIGHLFMVGYFKSYILDNVIWSLIHEMRISIVFPLLALILLKANWKVTLMICLLFSSFKGLNDIFNYDIGAQPNTSLSETIHYASMFLLGGLLAKHHEVLITVYRKCTRISKLILIITAFCCYTFYSQAHYGMLEPFRDIFGDYLISIGCIIFIVIALGSPLTTKFLELKTIEFLGKISYSLYLYHVIILTAVVYLFYGKLSLGMMYLLTIILSLMISTLSYRYIEMPAMKLGKMITSKKVRESKLAAKEAALK